MEIGVYSELYEWLRIFYKYHVPRSIPKQTVIVVIVVIVVFPATVG
jgi:hypothetical protein